MRIKHNLFFFVFSARTSELLIRLTDKKERKEDEGKSFLFLQIKDFLLDFWHSRVHISLEWSQKLLDFDDNFIFRMERLVSDFLNSNDDDFLESSTYLARNIFLVLFIPSPPISNSKTILRKVKTKSFFFYQSEVFVGKIFSSPDSFWFPKAFGIRLDVIRKF